MLSHTDHNLASLVALLDRLDRESLAAQRRITVPFLRRVMDAPP
jgi:DnaA family protein